MCQQEEQMQLSNQERMGFGRKPRGGRKFTRDADWSKLNLFMLLNRMSILMLLDPTQAMMIYQSLVHLPKHFMSMVDLTIWRILTIHCISNKCTLVILEIKADWARNTICPGVVLNWKWFESKLFYVTVLTLDLLLPISSPHPTILCFAGLTSEWFVTSINNH